MTRGTKAEQAPHSRAFSLRKIFSTLLKPVWLIKTIMQHKYLRKPSVKVMCFLLNHCAGKILRAFPCNKTNTKKNQFKIIIDPKNGKLDKIIYLCNVFEPEISKLIEKYENKNELFIDIGTNIGYHALYASQFFKGVIAFEPLPPACEQLKKSIKINNYKNVTLHQLACSNKEGKSRIYYYIDRQSRCNNRQISCKKRT